MPFKRYKALLYAQIIPNSFARSCVLLFYSSTSVAVSTFSSPHNIQNSNVRFSAGDHWLPILLLVPLVPIALASASKYNGAHYIAALNMILYALSIPSKNGVTPSFALYFCSFFGSSSAHITAVTLQRAHL